MSKLVDNEDLLSILQNLITKVKGFDTTVLSDAKAYADTKFGSINVALTDIQVVATLPTADISTKTLYLVPATYSSTNDLYDEYIYVNSNWEKIGNKQLSLTDYYTKTEIDTAIATMTADEITTFNTTLFPA